MYLVPVQPDDDDDDDDDDDGPGWNMLRAILYTDNAFTIKIVIFSSSVS